jgi:hypothetical protein
VAVQADRSRPWKIVTVGTVFVLIGGLGVGVAAAREGRSTPTVRCPSIVNALPDVPAEARQEVSRNLGQLNQQISDANRRLANSRRSRDPIFVENAILSPLEDKRLATIDLIATAIERGGERPSGLEKLAACTVRAATSSKPDPAKATGPLRSDFVNIRDVGRAPAPPARGNSASTGTFVARCGNNEEAHNNPDNHIVAPGVRNGAQHMHDYVGNLTTDGNSTDASLARGGTTCANNDRSAYFWPVLRVRNGQNGDDVNAPGGGRDGNVGQILEPDRVQLQFRGNPTSKVRAMPKFLRVITGDAKAVTNGNGNVKAAWTCSGFANRVTTKYPLCPQGSLVQRVLDFPSCWDGTNTDSANHRTHIVSPQRSGACPSGFKAVPQLRMTLTYDVPDGELFAVDAFPDQKHNPKTDHADFHNIMPKRLMDQVVNCINSGRRC